MKEYSYTKKVLLRELSENSRSSVTDLAGKLKCSRGTVMSNKKSLERELGLRYTIEFDKKLLGLVQKHIVRISFAKKPPTGELQKVFGGSLVQFAALAENGTDLFVDVVADSGEKYAAWGMGVVLKLLPYKPALESSLVLQVHTGFTPIPRETLESVNLSALGLNSLDRKILLLLNQNARMSYRQIARTLKEHVETVRYRIRRLMSTGIIKRFTVIVEKPPTEYNSVFTVNYKLAPGIAARTEKARRYYESVDEKMPLINTYQFLALTSGSSLLFGIGCFDSEEKEIKGTVIAHRELYAPDEPSVSYWRIKSMIKGALPVRNIDMAKSYNPLRWP